ncbi:endolytic transglycosylase MltG [Sandaracinus amylolyticus]|uniref:endolytic transglycosylase MltG n=1 Tax=Sandaracinus amylolyticus TaxID=927083 RepID=UPI001EFF7653|nr:endolytic transglycosylase MltG [Sandaracinus amylolyticus]
MSAKRAARSPRRGSRAGRASEPRALRVASVALLVLVGLAVAAIAAILIVYPKQRASGTGRATEITIASGERFGDLTARLASAGVIERPWIFAIYARLVGADEHLRAGTVVLTDDMSPREVVQRIAHGFGTASVEVLVPEGFHRYDLAARLDRWGVCSRDAFLEATEDRALLDELEIPGPTAEGYLFPDTYELAEGMSAHDVVRRMVTNHRRRTTPVLRELASGLATLERDLRWSPHEAIVLASIVEREAVAREEQPIIAGVFLNRLRDPTFVPHRLDADPTVSYGCLAFPDLAPSCAGFRGRISRAMTHDPANPYNTYRREQLPPGPISNPGLDALRAVLAPARHDYLFFVARGGGRHAFSRTLGEHSRTTARVRDAQDE